MEPERFRSAAYRRVIDAPASALAARFGGEQVVAAMARMAEQGYPKEVCGLLIGHQHDWGWEVLEARQVANLNTERATDRFVLDPAAYQRIDRQLRGSGQEIVGVFHSHPDCPARPSPTDLESAWEGFLYPIVSVGSGKAAGMLCWTLDDARRVFRAVTWEIACG
ncbi:MAG: M67 family peptidase [Zetaproteobacteria bacterium]|nr:MAG: M67 family peptidase [Zetaproteobacteria bacterium]